MSECQSQSQANELLPIIDEVETQTQRFLLRADGAIALGFDLELMATAVASGEVPEDMMKSAQVRGSTLIFPEDGPAIRSLLDKADAIRQRAS